MVIGTLGLAAASAMHILLASAVLHMVGERRGSLRLSLAWALLMLGPALLGRWTQSMPAALAASSLLAVIGVAALWKARPFGPLVVPPKVDVPRWAAILHLLLFALVFDTALEGYWWDEFSGHFGLTAVMAHGVFPPEFPLFPGEPMKYHYGCDVLSAAVRATTGASSGLAIDVVAIVSFGLLLLLARDLGGLLAGARGAILAPLLVPLGSGTLQFLLFPDLGSIELRASWLPPVFGHSMPPPVISNFFQHPQGLGMVFSLAVLLLLFGGPRTRPRTVLATAFLGVASLGHIVFFGVMGLALGAQTVLQARPRMVAAVLDLAGLAGALVLARALGGFLQTTTLRTESMIRIGSHFQGTPLEIGAQHLVMFGLPLLLLPWIVGRAWSRKDGLRLALLVGVLVGFAVPAVLRYERSWDMVKFYGVGAFFLNLLAADVLASWTPRSPLRRALLVGTIALSMVTGLHFLVRMGPLDGRLGVPNMHFPGPDRLFEKAGMALRAYMAHPRERVLTAGWSQAISTGLLSPGHDWRTVASSWMVDRAELDERRRRFQLARRHLRPADLDALGIGFAILQPHEQRALSAEGRTHLEASFELLEVVQLGHLQAALYRRK